MAAEDHAIKDSDNDLFHLAQKAGEATGIRPKLFQCCGTEDYFYKDNVKFRDFCRRLPIDLNYVEGQGLHEWTYCDKMIQDVLNWLPLKAK